MPLVLAIRNKNTIVVASDTDGSQDSQDRFGQIILLPNKSVLLIAGNLDAIRSTVVETVMPKIRPDLSAAGLAQLLQAALVVEIVPKLAELKGRVEFIVAGIDPVRHVEEPSLYYLDSAQDFYLQIVPGDAAAAGSTAAISNLFAGNSHAEVTTDQLKILAKECLSTTRLRWPESVGSHVRVAVITSQNTQVQDY